ncbi:carboxylate-amine ligase [Leucobacter chromiiresistens]|uniref:Putative glutamate--cysteine ligase 2 n=1 Tax=Leucobacter chromiiresistens TaxID=1079994 RepID=A0A147EME2_9MICO|nr:YbdK family carboxylate-amine ligase [Leucobacter chromiiresistens]KTR85596.1 carboxylate--amine ligase [Leucobacter chromiiresistens]
MARSLPAPPRFGIEEEYLLLDAETGLPCDRVDDIIAAIPGHLAEHEFFHSQLETATPICERAPEALAALSGFRSAAARAADGLGVVVAGTGLPPVGGDIAGTRVANPRYDEIEQTMRGMVTRYYSTGTHVHIEIPSREAGVEAMARIAPWSPVLVALTANSPLWMGEDTGYADWRYMSMQQWATAGYPPRFESVAEYDGVIDDLVRSGALLDGGLVNWSIRLSEKYPTIEARLADAQLDPRDAVAYGLLFRALVARALRDTADGAASSPWQRDVVRGAHWVAARNGLGSTLVDPQRGEPAPAFDAVDRLVEHVSEELAHAGDLDEVHAFVERRRRDGGAAEVQRTLWRTGGIAGLLELYRSGHGA